MSAPFDKAFKLFAEEDDIALLRIVAKVSISADALIEHLDRELDLPARRVDHLYRVTDGGEAIAIHMEAFSQYDSDWRDRHARYAAMVWAKYGIKLMCFMFLLTDRGVPRELIERYEIDAGDLGLRMRVRIVRMWEVPARDLMETGDPSLLAWVPLTNATPDELNRAAEQVAACGDVEIQTRMALLYGMRYFGSEVLEMLLTDEVLKESSYYQKILNKGRNEGERVLLHRQLIHKFGPLSSQVEDRLNGGSKQDLERWGNQLLAADSIEEALA